MKRSEMFKIGYEFHQAREDGEPIVIQYLYEGNWRDILREPSWQEETEYRRKPEPMEVWINIDENGNLCSTNYRTRAEAKFGTIDGMNQVHFIRTD